MCTPVELEALAIGFLFNEEIIQSIDEIASVRVCQDGDNIDVWLYRSVSTPEKWIRTSGCSGGKTSIRTGHHTLVSISDGVLISPENIESLSSQLVGAQDLYNKRW
jgi:FdhD protein